MLEVRNWMVNELIKSFRDLEVYQESYKLAISVHRMAATFPDFERYELASQIRRAAMSIPLNIAEGYGKKRSVKEFQRFLTMAMGSCNEVEVILDMVLELGYIKAEDHSVYTKKYDTLGRRLNVMTSKWKEF